MRSVAPAMREAISHSSSRSRIFRKSRTPPPPKRKARVEARFLVDRLDQVPADARLVLLVHLDEGLLPFALLFRRERDDLGLAGLPHRLERLVVLLLGDLVHVGGRVGHRLVERLADVRRQPVPELLVHDHRVAEVMVDKKFWAGLPPDIRKTLDQAM